MALESGGGSDPNLVKFYELRESLLATNNGDYAGLAGGELILIGGEAEVAEKLATMFPQARRMVKQITKTDHVYKMRSPRIK